MAELAIASPETESQEIDFVIGDVVDVTRRMWPGVNKPGGVGRITKIRYNEENNTYSYDVAYVLGARETKIEPMFIQLLNDDGTRKRSTVGRCRFCKSFFRDCGHDQDVNPFEEQDTPPACVTPTASAQKKPAPKTKEARPANEPRVRRYNGTSKQSENDAMLVTPANKGNDSYHSDSDGEPHTTGDDETLIETSSSTGMAVVTPFESGKKDRKKRRQVDLSSGVPSFAAASAAIAAAAAAGFGGSSSSSGPLWPVAVVAPTPPPAAPPAKKRVRENQFRSGSNYYGLSRLDPSNRDVAYNSVILDMHNTNRVVKLIENLNCLKRFTVHGEEQSTQFSLVC